MKTIIDSLNIGIRELLAVLIPGSLMCVFISLMFIDYNRLTKIIDGIHDNWIFGLACFAAVYFVGYIVYVYGSKLDTWYDKIKRTALELDKGKNANGQLNYIILKILRLKIGH